MNLPDMSTIRVPAGVGHADRVPAQTIRPSRMTIEEFVIEGARGSTRVAPTIAMSFAGVLKDTAGGLTPPQASSGVIGHVAELIGDGKNSGAGGLADGCF